jgi:chromosome segregation ATPase
MIGSRDRAPSADGTTRPIAEARERVASLDATLAAAELEAVAAEHGLAAAQDKLAWQRDVARRVEREIAEHRGQVAATQQRLGALVGDVVRISHKIRRAAGNEPPRNGHE